MMLTVDQIDNFWIFRGDLHNGELMPQLHDFARAIERAAREAVIEELRDIESCDSGAPLIYAIRALGDGL